MAVLWALVSAVKPELNLPAKPISQVGWPELLSPAGDWECARAAVENGADAIYFGLDRFNARMRAHNFTAGDLPGLMAYLHGRGVKGYVTFNTLVFPDEIQEAQDHIRSIIEAGVDAAIVQDVGLCRLIREWSPDFPIHASTQMTVSSPTGVAFAKSLGCDLVVLARECSLKEIEKIHQAASGSMEVEPGESVLTDASLPLEVFVHGALCVAYSGQCLTSEALGGRSANRGECAQACRMPYELISDGQTVPLGDRRYLLSPQDLSGLEVLPNLVAAGVSSLKIEGRLKTPEYVANITRAYRQALDALERLALPSPAQPGRHADLQSCTPDPQQTRYETEMAFSRGLSTGWFGGINNQELVHARFGKKRGVYLGEVIRVEQGQVRIQLMGPAKPGDGVVFDGGQPDQKEEGGRIYEVLPVADPGGDEEVLLTFGRGDVDWARVRKGNKIWKTSDPELDRELRRTYSGEQPRFKRPLEVEVTGGPGQPLTLMIRDEQGHVVEEQSEISLVKADRQPLTTERLEQQLGRLGATSFRLGTLINHLQGDVILPASELNRLRRAAITRLEELRSQPLRWTLHDAITDQDLARTRIHCPRPDGPRCLVLVRSMEQLEAVLASSVRHIYCEFENPKLYRDAVGMVRRHSSSESTSEDAADENSGSAREIWVAPPRIYKTGEEWVLKQVRSSEADGYLVRNFDHLRFFKGCRMVGDFSLNVANAWSARWFLENHGLERLTASYDLNIRQLESLLKSAPAEWFEVTLHQHMPMFHMEHCVFCAFLSKGTDYTNCGRPCDKHEVSLKDRVGAEHVLKADAGCRNTVYNARAQTGAEYVGRMQDWGARWFRLEFLNESGAEVTRAIQQYQGVLQGQRSGSDLWRELKLLNQLGVTRGQLSGS